MKQTHSDLIKAWADGAEIEMWATISNDWVEVSTPTWRENTHYRIKNGINIESWNRHKDVIMAYWEGKDIECRLDEDDTWDMVKKPNFRTDYEYRVNLEPTYFYQWERLFNVNHIRISDYMTDEYALEFGYMEEEKGWRRVESSRRTWND